MVITAFLSKSNRKNKKWQIIIGRRTTHFGDNRYQDYTQHKNKDRRRLYKLRHRNDRLSDIYSAGFWSMNLLWNKPTISSSIGDIEKKYKIKIISSLNK